MVSGVMEGTERVAETILNPRKRQRLHEGLTFVLQIDGDEWFPLVATEFQPVMEIVGDVEELSDGPVML